MSDVERILGAVSETIGVRIIDEWTDTDQVVFRGPHGRLESWEWSDTLGHWKRGPYCVESTLRGWLSEAVNGHAQWSGWTCVRRSDVGDAKPVVTERSTSVRCTLCHERFPSGNAFGWHLADVHARDVDDKSEFCTEGPESQHTLGNFGVATDGGRSVGAETERGEGSE